MACHDSPEEKRLRTERYRRARVARNRARITRQRTREIAALRAKIEQFRDARAKLAARQEIWNGLISDAEKVGACEAAANYLGRMQSTRAAVELIDAILGPATS